MPATAATPTPPAAARHARLRHMRPDATARTSPRTRQWLPWALVASIASLIPTGLVMADTLDDGLRLARYQVRVRVGWTVAVFALLLTVGGFGAILQSDRPPVLQADEASPAILDVATVRLGHQVGAYLFIALLLVHVSGSERHHARFGGAFGPMLRAGR